MKDSIQNMTATKNQSIFKDNSKWNIDTQNRTGKRPSILELAGNSKSDKKKSVQGPNPYKKSFNANQTNIRNSTENRVDYRQD